ncbi:hypothetical protein Aduo_019478 [Ancylostoma duodenale]
MRGILLLLSAVFPKIFVHVEGTTAFNCRNSLISDEWRQYVLDELNAYRRSLAVGEVYDKSKNYLPMAKNMNELKWDCNLEEMAYESLKSLMSSCEVPRDSISFPYQTMQVRFQRKNCNITSQTKIILYGWWEQIKNETVRYLGNNNDEPSIPTALQFAVMATATTPAFACTYNFCNNMPKGIMVCIYDDRTANVSIANRIIYQPAADKSQTCDACSKNCTEYLCKVIHTPVTLNTTCADDKLTQDSNNAALWMHNYYRRLLASGWAKDKKSKSGYAPPGKQMKKLEYDCSSTEKGLGSDTTYHDNSGITKFANMANDQADKVVCAVRNCQQSGQTLVVCQYNAMITEGEKIYETGKVCSGCRKLNPTRKCSDPAGLCE